VGQCRSPQKGRRDRQGVGCSGSNKILILLVRSKKERQIWPIGMRDEGINARIATT
jgi:hypothetical protein